MGEVTDEFVAKVQQHVEEKGIATPPAPQETIIESSSEQPTPPAEKITVEVIQPQEELQELPVDDETLTYAQSLTNSQDNGKETKEEKSQIPENNNRTSEKEIQGVLTSEQQSQLEQAQALLSDKRLLQFKDFLDKGGNLVDFAKNVIGEDVSKISDSQLFDEYLASRNFTPERITQEKENFESKTALEQEMLVKPMRDAKIAEQNKKANDYVSSVPDKKSQENQFVQQAAEKAVQELDALKEQYVGKKVDGVLMSDASYSQIVNDLKSGAIPAIPKMVNGKFAGYDVQQSIEMAHLWQNRNLIKKQHIEMGRVIGWNEYHKKRVRPSNQPTGSIPVTEQTIGDALKELHENKNGLSISAPEPYQSADKNSKAK